MSVSRLISRRMKTSNASSMRGSRLRYRCKRTSWKSSTQSAKKRQSLTSKKQRWEMWRMSFWVVWSWKCMRSTKCSGLKTRRHLNISAWCFCNKTTSPSRKTFGTGSMSSWTTWSLTLRVSSTTSWMKVLKVHTAKKFALNSATNVYQRGLSSSTKAFLMNSSFNSRSQNRPSRSSGPSSKKSK